MGIKGILEVMDEKEKLSGFGPYRGFIDGLAFFCTGAVGGRFSRMRNMIKAAD